MPFEQVYKATTSVSAALRATARVLSSGIRRITRITEPWVARVNAKLPGGSLLAGPGSYSARQLATETVGDGPVVFKIGTDWTEAQFREAAAHLDIANSARLDGEVSHVGRVSTKGELRREANAAVRAERARAAAEGNPYLKGEVAGHGPDTTWTNNPNAPYWQRQTTPVNSSFGGQANRYELGFRPTAFQARLPNGNIISGSLDLGQ